MLPIAEQVIKLKIKDFKLNVAQQEFGTIIKKGAGYGVVPGLHYGIENSKAITELIRNMDEIVYGQKHLNVNADLTVLKAEDVFGKLEE